MNNPSEFDYIGTAQKMAAMLPDLAQKESPEAAKASETMDVFRDLLVKAGSDDFLISVAIALSFNLQTSPGDNTLDDISDAYLERHPETRAKLEKMVEDIEKLPKVFDDAPGMKP